MNTHDEQPKPADLNESKGRRRFVRAVGVAVPVALTVSARSTMAATCNVVSAHASINLTNSHNSTTDIGINNNAQTFQFLTSQASQGASYFTQSPNANQNFSTTFGSGPNLTMRNVLFLQSGTFASYIAAAYVNLIKNPLGVGVCYDLPKLTAMWLDGQLNDYHPIASAPTVTWSQTDIINYLTDTWT